ncbi:hypothetical protein [Mucilaginibacter sp.]
MRTENSAALHFILQDDIFLLKHDREAYSHVALTVEQPEPLVVLETKQVEFNYLGGNKKNFLITVHYPGIDFMDDAHLTALQNTLKRLGFELDDIAILNLANHTEADYETISGFFNPKKMLLMGKSALPKNIGPIKLNEQQTLGNCVMLFSFSFDEMMDSNEYKKAFWEQMKLL